MKFPYTNIGSTFRNICGVGIKSGLHYTVIILMFAMAFSSCFTGVEGTKKISLSKEDKKAIAPSEEEEFFKPVAGQPLSIWNKGKEFIAADNKTVLIFDQEGLPIDLDKTAIGGNVLKYERIESRISPNGKMNAVIVFSCGEVSYKFNTGKTPDEAAVQVTSDQIPMMIDLDMVKSARNLLIGKMLWTRSPLWYDSEGNRISGRKFVPVTVTDVTPGTLVFPVKVSFSDEFGKTAWAFLNFGNSGKESRSFANLFSLTDIRKKYPGIEDDVWNTICNSKVKSGMTKLECKLSLGNPAEVDSGHDYTQTLDLWHYADGTVLWFEDGLLTRFRQ